MPDINTIGTAVACVVGTPATFDAAGFAALSWAATIGDLVEWGKQGDTSADISVVKIADGRTVHVNGARDGGEIAFAYSYTEADVGQVILRAQSGSNNNVSFRATHPNGKVKYCTGRVANVVANDMTVGNLIGESGVVRVNSVTVTV